MDDSIRLRGLVREIEVLQRAISALDPDPNIQGCLELRAVVGELSMSGSGRIDSIRASGRKEMEVMQAFVEVFNAATLPIRVGYAYELRHLLREKCAALAAGTLKGPPPPAEAANVTALRPLRRPKPKT